jgi:DNA-binding transcriptional LysR family regulator
MTRYPKITLQLGQGSRLVDLVREGVDCVVRAGEPDESGMIMRKLPPIPEMTCASPEYLKEYGTPNQLEDLPGHQMVGFISSRTGVIFPLEFETPDGLLEVSLPSRIVANDAETVHHLARLGFGLVQAPRYRFREDLDAGRLIEVLPETPPPSLPLAVYYPQNRQLSPRVRVFIEWVTEVFQNANL